MKIILLKNVFFQHCYLSHIRNPAKRPLVQNVILTKCKVNQCSIDSGVLENVLIDHLKCLSTMLCRRTALRHVTLKGKIGVIRFLLPVTGEPPKEVARMKQANEEYYNTVDWALDITEAQFKDVYIRDIPTHLIRRDPETQMIVAPQSTWKKDFRELDYLDMGFNSQLYDFVKQGEPDMLLIAPRRSKYFEDKMNDLERLREAQILVWE